MTTSPADKSSGTRLDASCKDGPIARSIVERYVADHLNPPPDAVILGCTHFPLLVEPIAAAFSPTTVVVDSASTTAERVAAQLRASDLATTRESAGSLRLLATDGATRFARVGGQFLGESLSPEDVTIVDI